MNSFSRSLPFDLLSRRAARAGLGRALVLGPWALTPAGSGRSTCNPCAESDCPLPPGQTCRALPAF